MPDLTPINIAYCPTKPVRVQGSRSKVYIVDKGRTQNYDYDWRCTCPAFKYSPHKHCKHIKKVLKDLPCEWNEFYSPEPYNNDGKCPCCGEKVEYIQMWV